MTRLPLRNFVKLFVLTAAVTALLLASSSLALAQRAGYDLLQTGNGASIQNKLFQKRKLNLFHNETRQIAFAAFRNWGEDELVGIRV